MAFRFRVALTCCDFCFLCLSCEGALLYFSFIFLYPLCFAEMTDHVATFVGKRSSLVLENFPRTIHFPLFFKCFSSKSVVILSYRFLSSCNIPVKLALGRLYSFILFKTPLKSPFVYLEQIISFYLVMAKNKSVVVFRLSSVGATYLSFGNSMFHVV